MDDVVQVVDGGCVTIGDAVDVSLQKELESWYKTMQWLLVELNEEKRSLLYSFTYFFEKRHLLNANSIIRLSLTILSMTVLN